jgi:hypothetical protein
MFTLDKNFLAEAINIAVSHGGVTVDLVNNKITKDTNAWFFPRYPDKTVICPHNSNLTGEINNFISINKNLLINQNNYLGVWLNPQTDEWYLDITASNIDRDDALSQAKQISDISGRKIVSIYNPFTKETIFL